MGSNVHVHCPAPASRTDLLSSPARKVLHSCFDSIRSDVTGYEPIQIVIHASYLRPTRRDHRHRRDQSAR
ncbi:hypothetical protein RB4526 [Rhodopirellula baltica SH 1]|uniref:Uncharacterized protein n=1 Tax=Rhodopirellula baltica (strain DSM 10527 / NCIMB 13988 / SH1) TaxID=243090 RepID=Q7USF8_RHOBA|nr:hypothetical protein RB4526 [Rhodopirellula baltica SH 1]